MHESKTKIISSHYLPSLALVSLAGFVSSSVTNISSFSCFALRDVTCLCSPLVAVGELHVHAVSAQEGLAVHRRVDVGRVWDGFAHQDSAGERRLFETTQPSWRAAVVHLQLSGAVQHLEGGNRRWIYLIYNPEKVRMLSETSSKQNMMTCSLFLTYT